jgi:hypothetical protein
MKYYLYETPVCDIIFMNLGPFPEGIISPLLSVVHVSDKVIILNSSLDHDTSRLNNLQGFPMWLPPKTYLITENN